MPTSGRQQRAEDRDSQRVREARALISSSTGIPMRIETAEVPRHERAAEEAEVLDDERGWSRPSSRRLSSIELGCPLRAPTSRSAGSPGIMWIMQKDEDRRAEKRQEHLEPGGETT